MAQLPSVKERGHITINVTRIFPVWNLQGCLALLYLLSSIWAKKTTHLLFALQLIPPRFYSELSNAPRTAGRGVWIYLQKKIRLGGLKVQTFLPGGATPKLLEHMKAEVRSSTQTRGFSDWEASRLVENVSFRGTLQTRTTRAHSSCLPLKTRCGLIISDVSWWGAGCC